MAQNLVLGLNLAHLADAEFFFKDLAPSVTKHHGQQSSCTISKKTNDPILKLSEGPSEGQKDESDSIGRCPTNVEHTIDSFKKTRSLENRILDQRYSKTLFSH